jgi:hypothetical protein
MARPRFRIVKNMRNLWRELGMCRLMLSTKTDGMLVAAMFELLFISYLLLIRNYFSLLY